MHVVIDVTVKESAKFVSYVQGHLPSIAQYGGKVLSRSMAPAAVEGDWHPALLVIHEWPDEAAFHRWYVSPEYAPWKAMRPDACELRMVLMRAEPPARI